VKFHVLIIDDYYDYLLQLRSRNTL